jgi:hypothetical protein
MAGYGRCELKIFVGPEHLLIVAAFLAAAKKGNE